MKRDRRDEEKVGELIPVGVAGRGHRQTRLDAEATANCFLAMTFLYTSFKMDMGVRKELC